jgi:hypothetical protein
MSKQHKTTKKIARRKRMLKRKKGSAKLLKQQGQTPKQ